MPRLRNVRREAFCQEYLKRRSPSATEAAKRAGYSEKTAYAQGHRLLKYAEIQARIDELRDERAKRWAYDQDRVLEELSYLALADLGRMVKWQENGTVTLVSSEDLDESDRRAIRRVRQTADGVTVELHDKRAALAELLSELGGVKNTLTLELGGRFEGWLDKAWEDLQERNSGKRSKKSASATMNTSRITTSGSEPKEEA